MKQDGNNENSSEGRDRRFGLRSVLPWGLGMAIFAVVLLALLGRVTTLQVKPSEVEMPRRTETAGLALAQEQLVPTTTWMNLYGMESFLDGKPLPIGSVVQAYDPQGVLCAEFTVKQEGRYGLMPVYGDDPTTPWDEGAVPGDLITIRVNGIEAVSTPATVLWTAHGDLQRVDLAVSSQPFIPSIETGSPLP